MTMRRDEEESTKLTSSSSLSEQLFSSVEGRLYGREKEEQQLLHACEQSLSCKFAVRHGQGLEDCNRRNRGSGGLIMVRGPSGSGKTALVTRVLQPRVTKQGGFFLKGKFDPLESPENYTPLISALTEFVHQIMNNNDDNRGKAIREEMKRRVEACCDTERLILDMVPALQQLIGRNSLLQHLDVKSAGAQARVTLTFQNLFRTLCCRPSDREEQDNSSNNINSTVIGPICLFLDDLQWAEPASLEVLATLVGDPDLSGSLVVVGACRSNEVSVDHHLSVTLREMENDGIHISNLEMKNFDVIALSNFFGNILDQTPEECLFLAEFISGETEGNIFFSLQLLRYLVDEAYLVQRNGRWTLKSVDEFKGKLNTGGVQRLLCDYILRMDKELRDTLMIASCFGAKFDGRLLQVAAKVSSSAAVQEVLQTAANHGLIEYFTCSQMWHFAHDQIQMSAYSLIPPEEKEAVHLQIGRSLWNGLSNDELDLHLNVLVNQLRLGANLLANQDERDKLAFFLLRAGEKATSSSSFLTAASHLNLGIKLLAPRHWRDQYDLSLDLFNAAAEVEYCNANYERMDELIASVLEHARSLDDKIRSLTLSVYSLGSRNEISKAIDLGFKVLHDLGEPIPQRSGTLRILMTLTKCKRTLARTPDSKILALPQLVDRKKLAALRIMGILFPHTLNCRPVFAPIIAMRLVQISLVHGLSAIAAVGFSAFGMLLCNAFGDVPLGIRLARIGLQITERFQAREWTSRVHIAAYGFCLSWTTDIWRAQLKPLLVGHRIGLAGGDIEFSMLCAAAHSSLSLHSCVPLDQVCSDSQAFLGMMDAHKQTNMMQFLRPSLQLALNLSGRCRDPRVLDGEAMCFHVLMQDAVKQQNGTVIAILHFAKLLLKGYWHEFEEAERSATALANNQALAGFSPFTLGPLYLHMGLASSALAPKSTHVRHRLCVAQRCLKKLESFSKFSPLNFMNKVHFLEAEILFAKGKLREACYKYELSIESAASACFWHEMGLAYERYAALLQKMDNGPDSTYCLEKAIAAYTEWGAFAKVKDLRRTVPVKTLRNDDLRSLPALISSDRLRSPSDYHVSVRPDPSDTTRSISA